MKMSKTTLVASLALALLSSCNTIIHYSDRSLEKIDFDIAFEKDELSPSEFNDFKRKHYFRLSFNPLDAEGLVRYVHLSYGMTKDFKYWIALNLFAETHCPYFIEGESILTARLDTGEELDFPYQKPERVGEVADGVNHLFCEKAFFIITPHQMKKLIGSKESYLTAKGVNYSIPFQLSVKEN
ncbi:MAG: hypothetical protein L7U87_08065 [Chlamydiales bacterium]|nr:hypothetical protein [Chlamydiales bacterium]